MIWYLYIYTLFDFCVRVWLWTMHNVDRYMDWHGRIGCRGKDCFDVLFGNFSTQAENDDFEKISSLPMFFLQVPFWLSAVYGWMFPSNQTMMKPLLIQACGRTSLNFWWVRLLCSVIVSFHGGLKVDLYFECSSRSKAHDLSMPTLHNFFFWVKIYEDIAMTYMFVLRSWFWFEQLGVFCSIFECQPVIIVPPTQAKFWTGFWGWLGWSCCQWLVCLTKMQLGCGFKRFSMFIHAWGKGSKLTSSWQKNIRFNKYVSMM